MMRCTVLIIASLLASTASANAINWQPHQMGKPLPAVTIAGGASGAQIYYLCRKRIQQRWHTGYTFGKRCHTARGGKELRHPRYQIAIPGKRSLSLRWRNHNNMEKHVALRSGPKNHNPEICRGLFQKRFQLIGHEVKRGCKAGFNNRSVLMTGYQNLTHSQAGQESKILDQIRDSQGKGGLETAGAIKTPSLSAGVTKFDPSQFWAGVLRRAERHSKSVAKAHQWGLQSSLGALLNRVLPWNQMEKAFKAVHPNKLIYRNGTGQGRRLKAGAKFGQYDRAFVRFVMNGVPARNPRSKNHSPQALIMKRVYDQAMRPLVRDFARVQHKLSKNARCKNRMIKVYKGLIDAKSYSPWSNFRAVMDPNYCVGRAKPKSGNDRMGQIALWWMRRNWDGTHQMWSNGIIKILRNYDRDFYNKLRRQR